MDEVRFEIIETIKEGISLGVKNIGPVIVNALLWFVTVWIPYLNVGTTIGLFVGVVSKLSKGEPLSETEIFNPVYRKYMGEFFLTAGLLHVGVIIGLCFFIIPGLIIGIAWCLALLILIDKGKNPMEAISLSNQCTYGYKWRIFAIQFILALVIGGINLLFGLFPFFIHMILMIAVLLFAIFIDIGIKASIYRQLTQNIE